MVRPPAWLGGLVGETFFVGCGVHETRKKNEKNIFCLECCRSICPHCASTTNHRHHPLLQVRRYVYNDVVRLDDLEKLVDCSYVQPYTINSAKVVFLKQRPQSRPFKGSGNICQTCDRILQDPFHFCSLSCKVDHVVMQGLDLSGILHRFNESDFAFSRFDGLDDVDGQITPNSILEDPLNYNGSGTGSGGGGRNSAGSSEDGEERGKKKKTTTKEKKKSSSSSSSSSRSGGGFLPQIVLSLGNRRKGAPQRSISHYSKVAMAAAAAAAGHILGSAGGHQFCTAM